MGGSWRYIALNIGTFFIRLWSQIHVVLKKCYGFSEIGKLSLSLSLLNIFYYSLQVCGGLFNQARQVCLVLTAEAFKCCLTDQYEGKSRN